MGVHLFQNFPTLITTISNMFQQPYALGNSRNRTNNAQTLLLVTRSQTSPDVT